MPAVLPDDLQRHIWRKYFSEHVLPELTGYVTDRPPVCLGCVQHGCPCVHCAALYYRYARGPGFLNYRQTIVHDLLDGDRRTNLLTWLINRPDRTPIDLVDTAFLVETKWGGKCRRQCVGSPGISSGGSP